MKRNLRLLALLLAASLGSGALAAASAQAEPTYTAGAYPTTGHGEGFAHRFTATAQTIECGKTTFEGTLAAASNSFTITPTYQNCKTKTGLTTDIVLNKCNYLFVTPVKIKEFQYFTPGGIVCPAGKPIEIKVTLFGAVFCNVTVFEQGAFNGMEMTDETETGDIYIEGGFNGVEFEEVGAGCPGEPGVLQNNGVYDLGIMTFQSKNGQKIELVG